MMKRTFGVALAAFCIGCLSAAQGDVLGEAKYLWDFDYDITGDGNLQIEEVRDARHWGSTNLSGYAGTWLPTSIKTNGIDKVGPQWRTGTVIQPMRGITSEGTYLHFAVGTNIVANADGTCVTNVSGCGIEYNTSAITGSVTVLLRLRVDAFDAWCNAEDLIWVVDNGETWNNDAEKAAGSNFGFNADKYVKGRGFPSVMFGKHALNMGTSIKTNVWYDIGISLRNTGDGGAEAVFMIRDPDMTNAVKGHVEAKTNMTKGVIFERKTCAAGSGAFMNEAKANRFIRIGGEDIGTVGSKGGSNARKCFAGDIQRIVMWDRALTTNELVEAALQTSSLFKIGYEDGANGEFGRVDEIVKPYDIDRAPFREMPQTLSAAHPVAELAFTPYSRSVAALGHMMRIKAASGAAGTTVLRVSVNGHVADTLVLSAGKEKWFYVKPGRLNATANAIRIERLATSTATSFNFDVVEMSGSWQVSETGNGTNDMSVEGSVPRTFYAGDWNFHGMQRGLVTSAPKVAIRFQMPAALALRHAFTYSGVCTAVDAGSYLTLTNSVANGGLGYPYRKWPLNVAVNGREYVTGECIGDGEGWSFTIPKGTLNAGWNEVTMELAVPADKAACWTCFDYLRLEVEPNPSHTLLIFR